MMSIASAFLGNGVLEVCRQAERRERAKCQQMDCLIKPMRILIQAGLVHVLLFPRGEIRLPDFLYVQLQRKVSHWV